MIFISYSSCDRIVAEALLNYLENRGIKCWIAFRDITSGNFSGEITRALRNSDIMVVVCSKESCRSEHVKNEVTLAFNKHKHIIPYLLEDNPYDDDMEYFLSLKQHIKTRDSQEKDFALIEKFIRDYRGEPAEPAPVAPVQPAPVQPTAPVQQPVTSAPVAPVAPVAPKAPATTATSAPAPAGGKKKGGLVIGIVAAVLLLGGGGTFFLLRKPAQPAAEQTAVADKPAEKPAVQPAEQPVAEQVKEEQAKDQVAVVQEQPKTQEQPKVQEQPKTTDASKTTAQKTTTQKTSTQSAGSSNSQSSTVVRKPAENKPQTVKVDLKADTFSGTVKDGYPDGFGTYTFKKRRRIDMHDPEERFAEAGDYIKGDWREGHLNYGEWYGADGVKKAFIRLGDNPDNAADQNLGKCVKK